MFRVDGAASLAWSCSPIPVPSLTFPVFSHLGAAKCGDVRLPSILKSQPPSVARREQPRTTQLCSSDWSWRCTEGTVACLILPDAWGGGGRVGVIALSFLFLLALPSELQALICMRRQRGWHQWWAMKRMACLASRVRRKLLWRWSKPYGTKSQLRNTGGFSV